MSDDGNRDERERHERETDEFGGPLFSESRGGRRRPVDQPTQAVEEQAVEEQESSGLTFGENDTGPLPHWTDPPTGEIPRFEPAGDSSGGVDDDIDVWSSFTSESPVWREDLVQEAEDTGQLPRDDVSGGLGLADPSGGFEQPRDPSGPVGRGDPSGPVRRTENTGRVRRTDPASGQHRRVPSGPTPAIGSDPTGPVPAVGGEPSRIQIGTDPSGVQRRQPPAQRRGRSGSGNRRSSSQEGGRQRQSSTAGRDMPVAVITALVIAGAFVAASMWRPVAVLAIIVIILAVASYEYFTKVAEKGYRPAVAAGVLSCIVAPITTYWFGIGPVSDGIADGQSTVPLVVAFAFIAGAVSFVGARSVESGPLPNMAITTMGVVWIGLLGSYAAMILTFSSWPGAGAGGSLAHIGTDTLVLVALGVAANDIGALFIGSSTGNTPLRAWISPNKSLEGLIGGTVVTIVALLVVGMAGLSDTWNDTGEIVLLAIVIAVMAPLGDLTESMFKRNLDVKDFGTLVPGHGGVLDRFDAFLFVLPAVYYLLITLQPWTS